jgi:hypothetical protein
VLSGYREQLVLKGAMLLAVLDARRMTRDADLSAHGIPNDERSVAAVVAEIATVTLPDFFSALLTCHSVEVGGRPCSRVNARSASVASL